MMMVVVTHCHTNISATISKPIHWKLPVISYQMWNFELQIKYKVDFDENVAIVLPLDYITITVLKISTAKFA